MTRWTQSTLMRKWFYMTKINNRYILVVGEELPKRTVANKHSNRMALSHANHELHLAEERRQ